MIWGSHSSPVHVGASYASPNKRSILEFLSLIIGFLLLIKASDYFVDSSINIAKIFRVPEIIIGATIVSIGTTLPETLVSALSAFKGHGDISFGNALGSIICNTALIAAISMVFSQSKINKKSIEVPCVFFLVAYIIYAFSAYVFGRFYRITGIILLLMLVLYIYYIIRSGKEVGEEYVEEIEDKRIEVSDFSLLKNTLILAASAIVIAFASNLLIDSATSIARRFNVPESVIGITIVAFGTSLPEFTTAITSLIKGHSSLSFGNIVGANLFNLLLVSGLAITIRPFYIPTEKFIHGINSTLLVDLPLALIVMLILCVPPLIKGETKKWQGIVLLVIYALFLVYQAAII